MKARYVRLRARLRRYAGSDRVRWCGARAVAMNGANIALKKAADGAHAHFVDLLLCGHIHDCPCCSVKLRAERGARIEAMLRAEPDRWRLLSHTIKHFEGEDLRKLQVGLAKAYARHKRGRPAQRDWSHVGATCRGWDHTHGSAGWHPHVHTLVYDEHPGALDDGHRLCTRCGWEGQRPPTDRGREPHCPRCTRDGLKVWSAWVQRESARWQEAVRAELGEKHVPDLVHGCDLTEPARGRKVGRYLAKMGLAPELAAGAVKRAKLKTSRSPWQIAEDLSRGDDVERDAPLWREYVRAMFKRRAIELDERAARKADDAMGVRRPSPAFGEDVAETSGDMHPLDVELIPLTSEHLAALRHLERTRMHDAFSVVLRAAEKGGAREVNDWLAYAGALLRDYLDAQWRAATRVAPRSVLVA